MEAFRTGEIVADLHGDDQLAGSAGALVRVAAPVASTACADHNTLLSTADPRPAFSSLLPDLDRRPADVDARAAVTIIAARGTRRRGRRDRAAAVPTGP